MSLLDVFGSAVGDHFSFTQDQQVGADTFHHFEHMGAVKNCFPLLPERPNQILENESGDHIQPGEWLIENEQLGIVQKGCNQEDALPHAFRVGGHRRVSARIQGQKFEQAVDFLSQCGLRHAAQNTDHLKVFAAAEIRIQIGLLGDVTQALAVADQVVADIFSLKQNLPAAGFEESGEHLDGGALSGTVRTEASQDLPRLQFEGDVLDGRYGGVVFGQFDGLEHRYPPLFSKVTSPGPAGHFWRSAEMSRTQDLSPDRPVGLALHMIPAYA